MYYRLDNPYRASQWFLNFFCSKKAKPNLTYPWFVRELKNLQLDLLVLIFNRMSSRYPWVTLKKLFLSLCLLEKFYVTQNKGLKSAFINTYATTGCL